MALRKSAFSKPQLLIFALVFGLLGIIAWHSFAANPNLQGDLNNDNTVNISDLSILLTNYGTTNTVADINSDGTVNITDLSILLSHYGGSYMPPSGTLIEQIDYSKATDYGWTWGIQAGNYGFTDQAHVGSIFETVLDPLGSGNKVAHIYLPSASSGGRAAEGLFKRSIDLGTTDYYGLSIRVPAGWNNLYQNPDWHTITTQLNYGSLGGPPIGLLVGQKSLELNLITGLVTADSSGNATGYQFQAGPNTNNRLYLTQNLPEATWVDVIIGVKWATTYNGWVNAWIRLPGGNWTQVVDSQKTLGGLVPTQQYGSNVEGHTVDINGIDAKTGQPYITADKAGLYAGPGADAFNIYQKQFLRGTTFDVVANKM